VLPRVRPRRFLRVRRAVIPDHVKSQNAVQLELFKSVVYHGVGLGGKPSPHHSPRSTNCGRLSGLGHGPHQDRTRPGRRLHQPLGQAFAHLGRLHPRARRIHCLGGAKKCLVLYWRLLEIPSVPILAMNTKQAMVAKAFFEDLRGDRRAGVRATSACRTDYERGRAHVSRPACCADALDSDPELLPMVRKAGVDAIWMACFLYGHWTYPLERFEHWRSASKRKAWPPMPLMCLWAIPVMPSAQNQARCPFTPPEHWKTAIGADGKVYVGTSPASAATEEECRSRKEDRPVWPLTPVPG